MASSGSSSPHGAQPGGVLHSWKEIAAFFDVSIRTVQNWEQDYGLPVMRMPGARGRVWARVEELEAWRSRCEDSGEIDFTTSQFAVPDPVPLPEPGRRRFHVWILAAVCVLGGFSVAGLFRARDPVRQLAGVRQEGDTLTGLDKRGQPLWSHVMPFQLASIEERNKSFRALSVLIADLDGDDNMEMVYPVAEVSGANTDELICFDGAGRSLWRYKPDLTLKNLRGEVFAGPWKVRAVRALPLPGGGADVLVALSHISMFPGVIVRVSRKGVPGQTYRHAGHIDDLVVRPGPDGEQVIYAAAIANSWKCVDLIILDPDKLEGYSQEPAGDTEHGFVGAAQAPERARVLIPPTRMAKGEFRGNTAGSLQFEQGQVVLEVREVLDRTKYGLPTIPIYFQVFTPELKHLHFRNSDSLEIAYQTMAEHGRKLAHPQDDLAEVSRGIRTLVAWH
jgi:hypothetical protein